MSVGRPLGFEALNTQHWRLLDLQTRISGSANSRRDFVIASHGEMTSVPAGTTPFFFEI
jgi:hypothetical protein